MDVGYRRRALALQAVLSVIEGQTLDDVAVWIRSFRISDMYKKPDQSAKARLVIAIKGTVMLPQDEEELEPHGDTQATTTAPGDEKMNA